MLDSITIKNFKAIGSKGLTLSGLSNVNYLVGKNGCGKSSVIEALAISYNDLLTSKISYKVSDNLKDLTKDKTFRTAKIKLSGLEWINNINIKYEAKSYIVEGLPNYLLRYIDINNEFQKKQKPITVSNINFNAILKKALP